MTQPLVNFLIRVTPGCKQMTEWASQSMERPLSLRQRLLMRLHFLVCVWCERYVRQLRLIRVVLRKSARAHPPERPSSRSLSPDARERLKETVRRGT